MTGITGAGIAKPYYRIFRSNQNYDAYISDKRYAPDRYFLCRAYSILEQELIKIFEYVEPIDGNKNVFSHRIYELLLLACTEFESNCKLILRANEYNGNRSNLGIKDYWKIERATKLSQYQIRLNIWSSPTNIMRPFREWVNSHSLSWYQDYNSVKHDRFNNFSKANFWNSIQAVAAVFAILYAQFSYYIFNPYNESDSSTTDTDGFIYGERTLFSIKPFDSWPQDEHYVLSWPLDNIEFQRFDFNKN